MHLAFDKMHELESQWFGQPVVGLGCYRPRIRCGLNRPPFLLPIVGRFTAGVLPIYDRLRKLLDTVHGSLQPDFRLVIYDQRQLKRPLHSRRSYDGTHLVPPHSGVRFDDLRRFILFVVPPYDLATMVVPVPQRHVHRLLPCQRVAGFHDFGQALFDPVVNRCAQHG